MDKKIGFIGSGNMAGAIIRGILAKGLAKPEQIMATGRRKDRLEALGEELGIQVTTENKKAAAWADILFLAVKPGVFTQVIPEICEERKQDGLVISIAAGQSIASIEAMFGERLRLVRVMPNTPSFVGEGMASISPNSLTLPEDIEVTQKIFGSIGRWEMVGEELMDAVIGVSGSSPAYVYMFIEAMADAAVIGGMAREQAYRFAAQAVYGSAKMVLETGKHPGELKDMVCSPAGTTIAAVAELEKQGLRKAVIEGCRACMEKSREMTEKGKRI